MSRISVAMATYNGERFLRKQLDSILGDIDEHDEIIISYDKSSDGTLSIIQEYEANYPQVKIVYDPGHGVFSNFENAIRHSSGDYIFISDQDDIWVQGKKERVLTDFIKENADMVIHNGVHINEKDDIITEDFFSLYNIKNGIIKNYIRPRYSGCCTAFKKELLSMILPIPTNVGAYDHWIGMVGEARGKVFFDDHVLIYHRIHGDNVTVSTRDLLTILRCRFNLLAVLIKRTLNKKY